MDVRDFYSGTFKVIDLRPKPLVVRGAHFEIIASSTRHVRIKYKPLDLTSQTEQGFKRAWDSSSSLRLSESRGVITGELGGSFQGRRFCISALGKMDVQGKGRMIHCFLEKWHSAGDQDDGEWHGESTG